MHILNTAFVSKVHEYVLYEWKASFSFRMQNPVENFP